MKHIFFNVIDHGDTVVLENAQVAGMTSKGFWLQDDTKDIFIPRSVIGQSDTDMDEVRLGEKITIEIPRWIAREKELVD